MPTGEGATTTTVVPGRAKREPGTHSHREKFGEDGQLPARAKLFPVVMGPRLRGDDTESIGQAYLIPFSVAFPTRVAAVLSALLPAADAVDTVASVSHCIDD